MNVLQTLVCDNDLGDYCTVLFNLALVIRVNGASGVQVSTSLGQRICDVHVAETADSQQAELSQ
ncbi:hypothetical protein BG000_010737, partial [Podila horticola]